MRVNSVTDPDGLLEEMNMEMESSRAEPSGPSAVLLTIPDELGIPMAGEPSIPPPTPEEDDRAFVQSLRDSGLLRDLSESLLDVYFASLDPQEDSDARQIDVLEFYYAGTDPAASARRLEDDHVMFFRDGDVASARTILSKLCAILPDIGDVKLEKIGGDDGALILRRGDVISAIADEEQPEVEDVASVSVREIVRSFNGVLSREGVRERFVELAADGTREIYVAVRVAEALMLCNANCLGDDNVDDIMEYAAW